MRGSCNYKNKNKNHKRSTGGEGRGVKKNQHGTGFSTTDKNRVSGESKSGTKGKRGKRKVLLNRIMTNTHNSGGCHNAGGTR